MARRKLNPWMRVTNEYVFTFAVKECPNCEGKGYVGEANADTKPITCSCATLAFRREMDEGRATGRVRIHYQRIGNRDVQIIEHRALGET